MRESPCPQGAHGPAHMTISGLAMPSSKRSDSLKTSELPISFHPEIPYRLGCLFTNNHLLRLHSPEFPLQVKMIKLSFKMLPEDN